MSKPKPSHKLTTAALEKDLKNARARIARLAAGDERLWNLLKALKSSADKIGFGIYLTEDKMPTFEYPMYLHPVSSVLSH